MLQGLEDLKNGSGRARPCAVTQWLDTLPDEDRRQAQSVLDDRSIPANRVQEFFNRNGASINRAQTVGRHRNEVCCTGLAA